MTKKLKPYGLTTPCPNCPFRTDIKPYLRRDSVEAIKESLVRAEFPCHKTTTHEDDPEGGDYLTDTEKNQHCAGALILLEKIEEPSQMMRICERLGMYDAAKLNMEAPVFDDWDAMIDAQER